MLTGLQVLRMGAVQASRMRLPHAERGSDMIAEMHPLPGGMTAQMHLLQGDRGMTALMPHHLGGRGTTLQMHHHREGKGTTALMHRHQGGKGTTAPVQVRRLGHRSASFECLRSL